MADLKESDDEFTSNWMPSMNREFNQRFRTFKLCFWAAALASLVMGCAQTKVASVPQPQGTLARPTRVYVYNFVASPDEVQLDTGLTAMIEDLVHKASRTEQEKALGRQVSEALAKHLVTRIRALGYEVTRAAGAPLRDGTVLAIQGQLISVHEGNQTERVIGLSPGRTNVKTITQVYDIRDGTRTLASEFETDARSRFEPGLTTTSFAGATTGNTPSAAGTEGGVAVVTEAFSLTVDVQADSAAQTIVEKLKKYFIAQGWILE